MFEPNKTYTKKDIYEILSVPVEKQKGAWDTGYREYEDNIYIFANVGIPGRTGSDYNNYWDGDLFHWEAKTNSNINQRLIQKMITDNPSYDVHLFTRTDNSLPFTYEGNVVAIHFSDTIPVKIVWSFKVASKSISVQEPTVLYEGGKHQVVLNKYERNPVARRMCIEYYGFSCQICEFNFFATYGELGKEFIHVHHIVPLAEIGDTYEVDPITDLIPVCPNCHAMIHRKSDFLSINDLKSVLFHKTD
ncbi:HNH endonuclease [Elizabethkingia anophelis]|uniref:HNH endonuclease n=1 Tax=Elizabethkingia anophelis TaxID=1117645 RepID=UPI0008400AA7|nr:DUF3427 domain-containing protein [Elizabethkingia anophelis]OCW74055.1 hypothetical protein A4G24_02760 [Elizabethkingia anophelis]CAH1149597.1 hypothetical protein EAVVTKC53_03002 [Elizabethkingia anophelis]CAI9678975.1 hypothetical protein EAVVTKC53_00841 [Elizabethkingia anophelis]